MEKLSTFSLTLDRVIIEELRAINPQMNLSKLIRELLQQQIERQKENES